MKNPKSEITELQGEVGQQPTVNKSVLVLLDGLVTLIRTLESMDEAQDLSVILKTEKDNISFAVTQGTGTPADLGTRANPVIALKAPGIPQAPAAMTTDPVVSEGGQDLKETVVKVPKTPKAPKTVQTVPAAMTAEIVQPVLETTGPAVASPDVVGPDVTPEVMQDAPAATEVQADQEVYETPATDNTTSIAPTDSTESPAPIGE